MHSAVLKLDPSVLSYGHYKIFAVYDLKKKTTMYGNMSKFNKL